MENSLISAIVVNEQIAILTNVASGPCIRIPTDTLKDDVTVVVLDCEVLCGRHFVYLQLVFGLWSRPIIIGVNVNTRVCEQIST